MASPGEDERLESEFHDEEEGGPVKSFLEHLEDLRWVLIKGVVAVGVLMIICLIGANYILAVVKWPLERADKYRKQADTELAISIGTNVLTTSPGTNFFRELGFSNQTRIGFELVPKLVASNYVLTIQLITNEAQLAQVRPRGTILRNLSPVGGFWVAFQVALYGGIVIAAPYLIYVIGQFVIPALKYKEKKYVLRGFAIGTALFMSGVCFCYFALMPMALRASFQYSEWLGFSADEWRAEDYISFVCKFMLGMGLGFELPVVILTLVKVGVLDHHKLRAMRRYMIVVNLFLGAILTTPEVVTQVLMFIPLQALYELSVWIAGYWEMDERGKRRARRKLFVWILIGVAVFIGLLWQFHPGFHAWAQSLIG
ncbi:MAG TPA: twin-arginine translocase subunit TatC [Methylomirabilota bacterium]|nr:twin-arginine translocase subunit TatC [Methylomirabilota bacterium]